VHVNIHIDPLSSICVYKSFLYRLEFLFGSPAMHAIPLRFQFKCKQTYSHVFSPSIALATLESPCSRINKLIKFLLDMRVCACVHVGVCTRICGCMCVCGKSMRAHARERERNSKRTSSRAKATESENVRARKKEQTRESVSARALQRSRMRASESKRG